METTAETSDGGAATKHPEAGSQPGRPPMLQRGQIYAGTTLNLLSGMAMNNCEHNSLPLADGIGPCRAQAQGHLRSRAGAWLTALEDCSYPCTRSLSLHENVPSIDEIIFGSYLKILRICKNSFENGEKPYRIWSPDDHPRLTPTPLKYLSKLLILYNSVNMDPIEAALDSLKSMKVGESPNYSKVAKEFSCSRVTLSRRHRGV
jgi:hypothetical protein